MALRMIDSFDHYVTAHITRKWTSVTGAGTRTIVAGGRHGNCLALFYSSIITKTLDAQGTWIVGFAYKNQATTDDAIFLQLLDVGTVQVSLRTNYDGTLSVLRGDSVVLATSAKALNSNTWYFIEMKATISDLGSYQVQVNGEDWIPFATGDTQNAGSANASANQIQLRQSSIWSVFFDDLYICDGTTDLNNDFRGDVRIEAIFPDANGTHSDFTGNDSDSTDNFLLVDDKNVIACTPDYTTDTFSATYHRLENTNTVKFSTTDTLPTGLSAATTYYIISSGANTFQVSTSSGGAAVNFTTNGIGDLSVVRQQATPDDDTTTVQSLTVDHRDTYFYEDVAYQSGETSIDGIQILNCVKKTEAGDKTVCPALVVDGVDYDGDNVNPSESSYSYVRQVYEQTPDGTPEDWTPTIINASEFGLRVVV